MSIKCVVRFPSFHVNVDYLGGSWVQGLPGYTECGLGAEGVYSLSGINEEVQDWPRSYSQ